MIYLIVIGVVWALLSVVASKIRNTHKLIFSLPFNEGKTRLFFALDNNHALVNNEYYQGNHWEEIGWIY